MKKVKLERAMERDNAAELFDADDRKTIAEKVIREYDGDENDRRQWLESQKEAIKLARQIREMKTKPWRGASNVKFPLITIAALQFHARVYPMLVDNDRVVKVKVFGADPEQMKAKRAERLSQHMSYQLLEEDEGWEEDTDRLLMTLPVTGTEFKKTYMDIDKGQVCSVWVPSQDLCLPYYARSLEESPRKSLIQRVGPRRIKERMLAGYYLDEDLAHAPAIEEDGQHSTFEDDDSPRKIIEQHCFLDLDGDGYTEPYVVVVDYHTSTLLRITRRFDSAGIETSKDEQISRLEAEAEMALSQVEDPMMAQEIENQYGQMIAEEMAKAKPIKIRPIEYFTKYSFVPSMDGSIYDQGFGTLLGDNNHAVNTLINQLIDSGTLNNMQSGFLGRGARIKGGKVSLQPNEWKRINIPGDDLRKNIVPIPTKEPSGTLFQLLLFLVNYGERIASVTDMMVGETPGQNTPASTSMAALEQGMKVFTGITKRVYRGGKAEYRKVYENNRYYVDLRKYQEILDIDPAELAQDYAGDPKDVRPVGDPKMLTDTMKQQSAMFVSARADVVPGYDKDKVEQMLLRSNNVVDTEEVYPTGENRIQPPPNPEIELQKAEQERKTTESMNRQELEWEKLRNDDERLEIERAEKLAQIAKIEAEIEAMGDKAAADKVRALADMLKATREKREQRSNSGRSEGVA